MAYTPKPDREVKDGKAVVSAKELADFKSQYGADKSLRDLLNMDKGLRRKGEGSAPAAIKVPTKAEAAALEVKGLTNQKAHQDEEEKAEANASKEKVSAEEKPFRSKNLTDLLGLSSNIKKTTNETTPKETSKVKPDFTSGKVPTSEQARVNREAVASTVKETASAIGDVGNKPYVSPAMRKAEENKGKTYRDLSGKVQTATGMKHGGSVKKMASGGMTSRSSASSRGDGIASRGKTRGKIC